MSKYVNPTGEGYQGVYRVRNSSVAIPLGLIDVSWDCGQVVYPMQADDGVAIVDQRPHELLGEPIVLGGTQVPELAAHMDVCHELGVSKGDDVRVYSRDKGGLLLVDADNDPRVGGGR